MAAATSDYGFLDLRARYVLECRLTQLASMHIGTGVSGDNTDAPFITQGVTPFVPGSSLRGVMRSTAERVARSLGTNCCVLFEESETTCWAGNKTLREKFEKANARDRTKFLRSAEFHLCPLCRLFGSTLMAAQLKVGDAAFSEAMPKLVRRDGVGIDRDTETARPKIKYDFQVAEREAEGGLKFTLEIENAGPREMGVLYIVLTEMERGFAVGGKKSRGLGEVKLTLEKVSYFDSGLAVERRYTLRQFLDSKGNKYKDFPVGEFHTWLAECFQEFLKPQEKTC